MHAAATWKGLVVVYGSFFSPRDGFSQRRGPIPEPHLPLRCRALSASVAHLRRAGKSGETRVSEALRRDVLSLVAPAVFSTHRDDLFSMFMTRFRFFFCSCAVPNSQVLCRAVRHWYLHAIRHVLRIDSSGFCGTCVLRLSPLFRPLAHASFPP